MDQTNSVSKSIYKPIEILLIEDNPLDARLTIEALEENKIANLRHISHVTDGEQAIKYLSKEFPFESVKTPDIVLLDLNLPKISGYGVLQFVRSQSQLNKVPIIMLTSSTAEQDITSAYEQHVNAYIAKPVDFDDFLSILKNMEEFWLHAVELPGSNT
ncbi:hypothetical protein AMS58_06215 [Pseudoalteromonas porphyrae]|uniref:response regulator n=1 Tax=Pseudoalteromonas porphyrae TaxID=187330 RepID=UPI0006BA95B4|nr:response regulator [Pseudoalteromonas porphyrae]KPH95770.1 hypothetical protein AMS58_06215 [Pseudoalteromonas porphyrae]